jgi:hypothetical protein
MAALLLVVQSGLYLLAALGLYSYARLSDAIALLARPEAVAFGGPVVLLLLAVGVAKRSRAARLGVYAWESLTLLGTAFSVLISGGSALTLTVALTGVALPAAVLYLVRQPPATRQGLRHGVLIGLLLVTAFIHLSLVPEPVTGGSRLGAWFLVDAVAFLGLAVAIARGATWWHLPTGVLLVATILAYLVVVLSGRESIDDLGIATKLVELAALGLTVWPTAQRRSWSWLFAATGLVAAIVFSGGLAWAASLRPTAAGAHQHDGKVLLAEAPPTDEQRLAAARLIDDTRAGIERFSDLRVALADGYLPMTPPAAPTVHYVNQTYVRSGDALDPTRPQGLVYANTPNGPLLLGAMYMMPKANAPPPNIGGSLVEWHTHSNLCFSLSLPRFAIDGLQSPFGTCPVGSINAPTPAMLHVWTVPNPAGPFADLSPAFVSRLTH